MQTTKLVCFDMDDTLIKQNSWYKLNVSLGVTPEEDKKMYEAYSKGELRYEDWLRQLVGLYKRHGKANKSNIIAVLEDYEFAEGAEDLVSHLKEQGYEIVIISGSFDFLVANVAEALGVSFKKGNTSFIFDDKDELVEVISLGDELHAKLEHLKTFCNQLGIGIDECICIGDGANDIELFRATRRGITFQDAPTVVKSEAWKIVDTLSDIKAIL